MINGSDPATGIRGAWLFLKLPVATRGVRSVACVLLAVLVGLAGLAGCTDNNRQIKPDPTAFSWPGTVIADPAGDYVYVVSTNFDSKYTGGTVIPIEVRPATDSAEPRLAPAGAVEIGAFGGEPAVSVLEDGRTRLWVPIRDGDALNFADVDRAEDGTPMLYCRAADDDAAEDGSDDEAAAAAADDAAADELDSFHRCAGDYVVKLKDYKYLDEDGEEYFADDAFGVAVGRPFALRDGQTVYPLYVSGIVGSALTVFTVDGSGALTYRTTAWITEGAHSVMEFAGGELDRTVWISNRTVNEITILNISLDRSGNVTAIPSVSASADLLGSSGEYFRGFARSPVRPFVYAAYRSPAALTVFGIEADGMLRYRGLVQLDGSPSNVAVYVTPDGDERVYVTESSLDFVYVVDPVAMTVVDKVFVGAAPAGIAITDDRAFVANFEDSSVSWFGVDPSVAGYHVARTVGE